MNIIDASLVEAGRRGVVGFRPQDVTLTEVERTGLAATVALVETVGSEQHVHLRLDADDTRVIAVAPPDRTIPVDSRVGLTLRRDRLHYFTP
jgi:sn-glycerol 3-phosphate transport system ATP-binding protein